ncbi:MAG: 5'-deoxynucleotidase [Clostridiales bacterium]|nr:5'-deoxynucleotidase [Clostridiales bacterium]
MSHFFAYLDRLKLIRRWGLMRNIEQENDMEHSMQTAMIAHGLAVLGNRRYHRSVDPEKVVTLALYHDASEALTGDLPTPVKYKNPEMQSAYQDIERRARQRLTAMLPKEMQPDFLPYLQPDEESESWQLVKAADRISAYIKCLTEEKLGNGEFAKAKETILESLQASPLPEVEDFLREFVPSYTLTPDELSRG